MDKDAINFLVRMGRCVEASKELSEAAQYVIDLSEDTEFKDDEGIQARKTAMYELKERIRALKEYID